MDGWMKEIQELEGYGGIGGYAVYFENKKQFEWLKEQAEKVRELEEVIHLYKLRKENALELNEIVIKPLKEENQRYKEALEFYADRFKYHEMLDQSGVLTVIEDDCGFTARQALKGESV